MDFLQVRQLFCSPKPCCFTNQRRIQHLAPAYLDDHHYNPWVHFLPHRQDFGTRIRGWWTTSGNIYLWPYQTIRDLEICHVYVCSWLVRRDIFFLSILFLFFFLLQPPPLINQPADTSILRNTFGDCSQTAHPDSLHFRRSCWFPRNVSFPSNSEDCRFQWRYLRP